MLSVGWPCVRTQRSTAIAISRTTTEAIGRWYRAIVLGTIAFHNSDWSDYSLAYSCCAQTKRSNRAIGSLRPSVACAVTRRRFPVGASPTRQTLQPEAIGAVMEVTKWLKPSISVSRIGDSASVQAATRVNAEQSSKRTMRRSTRQPYRGRLIRLDEMSEAIRSDAAPG